MRYLTTTIEYYPRQRRGEPPTQPTTGRVKIEIDIDAIDLEIGRKALRSKSGRATAYGGLIKARRIK